jgi:chloramphenicol 3-O phosphotransferase
MAQARVVIINGVGSVGKSCAAHELQRLASTPLLYIALDQFLDGLPDRLIGSPEGMMFVDGVDEGKPSTGILTGAVFERFMSGMRHAIAALADQGNDLIVDEVFWNGEDREYRRLLKRHDLRLVALTASLEVIEERERVRGDRRLGLARWQYGRVHRNVVYDLEIDVSCLTPTEAAGIIVEAFQI